ncbi:hypothetical protein Efla_000695 [Eimeria flavescens]
MSSHFFRSEKLHDMPQGSSAGLTVKRGRGLGRMAVQVASNSVAPASAAASRFVELSHAAPAEHRQASDLEEAAGGCPDEGCVFAEEAAELVKTKKERMQKQAKKLRKKAAKLRKRYLKDHTEEDYELIKYQSIIAGLENELNGGSGEAEAAGEE